MDYVKGPPVPVCPHSLIQLMLNFCWTRTFLCDDVGGVGANELNEEGEDEDIFDESRKTIDTLFSELLCSRITFLHESWFWPVVYSYGFSWSSQIFPSDNVAGVSSKIFTV